MFDWHAKPALQILAPANDSVPRKPHILPNASRYRKIQQQIIIARRAAFGSPCSWISAQYHCQPSSALWLLAYVSLDASFFCPSMDSIG